jgi:hypothetical protein
MGIEERKKSIQCHFSSFVVLCWSLHVLCELRPAAPSGLQCDALPPVRRFVSRLLTSR